MSTEPIDDAISVVRTVALAIQSVPANTTSVSVKLFDIVQELYGVAEHLAEVREEMQQ